MTAFHVERFGVHEISQGIMILIPALPIKYNVSYLNKLYKGSISLPLFLIQYKNEEQSQV